MIRALIADDHAPTRADVRDALEADPDFEVVAAVRDAPAAIEAALRERPDVCLLDVRMPGGGTSAAWEITARLPTTKVVMLTVSRDDDDLFAALRAGASGYLLKDLPSKDLPQAIRDVLNGEAAIPGALVARLIGEFRDRAPKRRILAARQGGADLTSREWEVLDLLRADLSTAEIARRLVISQATVRSHIAAVLHKLRVPDRETARRLFDEQ
jgi:DNA-binding NarL/FixJ family response regulator